MPLAVLFLAIFPGAPSVAISINYNYINDITQTYNYGYSIIQAVSKLLCNLKGW